MGVSTDRLPIVVSGINVEKLLGIPSLPCGTGLMMAETIIKFLEELWNYVVEHLAGLCFDTTISNTGVHTGAITVVQRHFSKGLLF